MVRPPAPSKFASCDRTACVSAMMISFLRKQTRGLAERADTTGARRERRTIPCFTGPVECGASGLRRLARRDGLVGGAQLGEDRAGRDRRAQMLGAKLGHERLPERAAAFLQDLGPDRECLGSRRVPPP